MGATYKVGRESVQKFRAGYDAVAKYMNADVDEIGMVFLFHINLYLIVLQVMYRETKK